MPFPPRFSEPRLAGALTQAKAEEQGIMLANRVWKTWQHLNPRFRKQDIGAFRLYDRDIPEIRAVVDAYVPEGQALPHLVISEYERLQTETVQDWLGTVARAVATRLELPRNHVHLKRRRTGGAERGYGRMDQRQETLVVREGTLRFRVNLDDFLDTGLFADHRPTRDLVRQESAGKKVLNLFAYTGSFSVAAGAGEALTVTSVDASERYLAWAEENLRLNGQQGTRHRLVATDVRGFLARHAYERWDLVVCDPPSFSVRPDAPEWDVQRDHPELLRSILGVLNPGGVLWFSTNHQRFAPDFRDLPAQIADRTEDTVPKDYRNRQVHQCWRMTKD